MQEVEKKIDELKSSGHELRKEITKRKHEIEALNDELENAIRQNELLVEELQTTKEQSEALKVCNCYCCICCHCCLLLIRPKCCMALDIASRYFTCLNLLKTRTRPVSITALECEYHRIWLAQNHL